MMIEMLPAFMRKSVVYNAIFDAEAPQFQITEATIADINLQLSVDTATWGLVIYEKELRIITDLVKPLSERRSVIKSKMRGSGKVDATLIKIVADSYTNGNVDVSFNGGIRITFVGVLGVPPNMNDLMAAIEEIKPAHLRVEYVFRYFTYNELVATGMTYGELAATGKTYDEVYNRGLI